MKNKILITVAACVYLTMQLTYAQKNAGADALKQKAFKLLNALEGATPVAEEDNLIRLSVDSVKKSGDDYEVYMKCYNKRVGNAATGTVLKTHFIDPENYKNNYQPYTIDDEGFMNFSFQTTLDGTAIIPVKLKPASKIMYVYCRGIEEPEMAELHTVPLFFTIVLGDKPFVLEAVPRHAGTLFNEALEVVLK